MIVTEFLTILLVKSWHKQSHITKTGPQKGPTIFLTGCEKEEPQLIPGSQLLHQRCKYLFRYYKMSQEESKERKDIFVLFEVLCILKAAAL